MKTPPRSNTVHSLERGLAVLELVAAAGEPIGITELARKLGLAKGSVARLVATLVKLNYLVQVTESRKYHLGLRLWELGSRSITRLSVLELARPIMRELHEATGETTHLTVLTGEGRMVFLDKIDSTKSLRPNVEIGGQLPLHCVANGKAILALLPNAQVESMLPGRLQRFTGTTITSKAALSASLAAIRKEGYALNRGEYRKDVSGIAAAIVDGSGLPVAALGISLPTSNVTEAEAARLGQLVAAKARKVSVLLGGRPDDLRLARADK